MITVTFTGEIESPVTAAELQSWLELPETDAKLAGMTVAATDAVTTYLRRAILPVGIKLVISGMSYFIRRTERYDGYPYIELPYADLVSITDVTLDDDTLVAEEGYVVDSDHTPARLHLFGSGIEDRLIISYVAGAWSEDEYGTPVPQAIKTAILMVAAYMYEHRGMCDAKEAIENSGAITYLRRYRIESI